MKNSSITKLTVIADYFSSLVKGGMRASLFDGIQRYVMFIGYPRSGHSLIGALLDAHPNMIIAHELNALKYFQWGFSKNQVFSLLLDNSKRHAASGRTWTGYSYAVSNQFQGTYSDLRVIGDKKGGGSALLLKENPKLLDAMEQRLGLPVTYLHVYRNPFDNITTWARGGNLSRKLVTEKDLERTIPIYFSTAELMAQLKKNSTRDILDIKQEDFIQTPAEILKNVVHKIGLEATEDYLSACSRVVFEKPKKTRHRTVWSNRLVDLVMHNMRQYSWLKDYDFDH